jgi:hypothetical protein
MFIHQVLRFLRIASHLFPVDCFPDWLHKPTVSCG